MIKERTVNEPPPASRSRLGATANGNKQDFSQPFAAADDVESVTDTVLRLKGRIDFIEQICLRLRGALLGDNLAEPAAPDPEFTISASLRHQVYAAERCISDLEKIHAHLFGDKSL